MGFGGLAKGVGLRDGEGDGGRSSGDGLGIGVLVSEGKVWGIACTGCSSLRGLKCSFVSNCLNSSIRASVEETRLSAHSKTLKVQEARRGTGRNWITAAHQTPSDYY